MISLIMAVVVGVRLSMDKSSALNPKYATFLFLYITHIIFGMVYNEVTVGVAFAATRIYFKFLPFFLLPSIFLFEKSQIDRFLRFMMWLTLLQFPVVIYQRFVESAGVLSGDRVGGTLGWHTSGILSVYLCLAASMTIAHFLRDRIPFRHFMILLFCMLAPTSLNETKIVFFLIPLIFFLPFLLSTQDRGAIQKLLPMLIMMIIGILGIQLVYDIFVAERWGGRGIMDFFTTEGRMSGYVTQTRWLPIEGAWAQITQDPMQFILGVGAGNAHESFTAGMNGRYATAQLEELRPISTGLSGFLWELGFGGVSLILWFYWMLFKDAIHFAKAKGYMGIFGLTMISGTVLFTILLFYNFAFDINIFVYTFFLMAGFLATGEHYAKAWENE